MGLVGRPIGSPASGSFLVRTLTCDDDRQVSVMRAFQSVTRTRLMRPGGALHR